MTNGEKQRIRNALRLARMVGYQVTFVYDGGSVVKGKHPEMTDAEVINACASVDDSHIHFVNPNAEYPHQWARVILGNARDGSEVIADNSCSDQAFDDAMAQAMQMLSSKG